MVLNYWATFLYRNIVSIELLLYNFNNKNMKIDNKKIIRLCTSIACLSLLVLSLAQAIIINPPRSYNQNKHFDGDGDIDITSSMDNYPLPTSGSTSYSSYLKFYFDNLTQNFGMNYMNTCGYVSLAMLLSYYDSVLDGDLVPDCYDIASRGPTSNMIDRRNTPGVIHDDFDNMGHQSDYQNYLSPNTHYGYISLIKDVSLHAKLISIGNYLQYIDDSTNGHFGRTTLAQRQAILEHYLSSYLSYPTTSYTITSVEFPYVNPQNNFVYNQTAIRSDVISLIASGKPVLIGITESNNPDNNWSCIKHACIAYDYSFNRDNLVSIYCHPGVSNNGYSTHFDIDDFPTTLTNAQIYIYSYAYIDFDSTYFSNKTPGDNYKITYNNAVDVFDCSYNSSDINYSSTHSSHHYSTLSDGIDDYYHKTYCLCGDYTVKIHTFTNPPSLTYWWCDDCGRWSIVTHGQQI